MVGSIALVLDRYQRDILLLQAMHMHVAIHLQGEYPQQVGLQRTFGGVIKDGQERALRMGLAAGHLLLAHNQADIEQARSHMVPALDRRKTPVPPPT